MPMPEALQLNKTAATIALRGSEARQQQATGDGPAAIRNKNLIAAKVAAAVPLEIKAGGPVMQIPKDASGAQPHADQLQSLDTNNVTVFGVDRMAPIMADVTSGLRTNDMTRCGGASGEGE